MTEDALDTGWAEWYDCYFGTYGEDAEFFVNEAARAEGRVLEAGCGTGRLTIPMLQGGARVVGFDPMPEMLERLKARAMAAGVQPEVSAASMESFDSSERFELILAPFRVFNHCLTQAAQRAAFVNLRRLLAPEGRLIVATFVPDPELITSATNMIQYMATVRHPETGLPVICSQFNAEIDPLRQVRTDVWIHEELNEDQSVRRKAYLPLTIRWVLPSEMPLLLELAGFQEFQVFGGFNYEPLDDASREQIWIAR
jgi:SAM-dependent methyltransferase